MARLCECAGSFEPSLLAYAISTKISCIGIIINRSCINIASYKCGIVQAANAQNMLSYLSMCLTWLELTFCSFHRIEQNICLVGTSINKGCAVYYYSVTHGLRINSEIANEVSCKISSKAASKT